MIRTALISLKRKMKKHSAEPSFTVKSTIISEM